MPRKAHSRQGCRPTSSRDAVGGPAALAPPSTSTAPLLRSALLLPMPTMLIAKVVTSMRMASSLHRSDAAAAAAPAAAPAAVPAAAPAVPPVAVVPGAGPWAAAPCPSSSSSDVCNSEGGKVKQ